MEKEPEKPLQPETPEDDKKGGRRSRRTPSKYGNYYEYQAVDHAIEGGENKEVEEGDGEDDEDDSDEDPSWGGKKGASSSEDEDYESEGEDVWEGGSNSKKKRGGVSRANRNRPIPSIPIRNISRPMPAAANAKITLGANVPFPEGVTISHRGMGGTVITPSLTTAAQAAPTAPGILANSQFWDRLAMQPGMDKLGNLLQLAQSNPMLQAVLVQKMRAAGAQIPALPTQNPQTVPGYAYTQQPRPTTGLPNSQTRMTAYPASLTINPLTGAPYTSAPSSTAPITNAPYALPIPSVTGSAQATNSSPTVTPTPSSVGAPSAAAVPTSAATIPTPTPVTGSLPQSAPVPNQMGAIGANAGGNFMPFKFPPIASQTSPNQQQRPVGLYDNLFGITNNVPIVVEGKPPGAPMSAAQLTQQQQMQLRLEQQRAAATAVGNKLAISQVLNQLSDVTDSKTSTSGQRYETTEFTPITSTNSTANAARMVKPPTVVSGIQVTGAPGMPSAPQQSAGAQTRPLNSYPVSSSPTSLPNPYAMYANTQMARPAGTVPTGAPMQLPVNFPFRNTVAGARPTISNFQTLPGTSSTITSAPYSYPNAALNQQRQSQVVSGALVKQPVVTVTQQVQRPEEDIEPDPQRRTLLSLVKQCEQYANQIRDILKQWSDKSKNNPQMTVNATAASTTSSSVGTPVNGSTSTSNTNTFTAPTTANANTSTAVTVAANVNTPAASNASASTPSVNKEPNGKEEIQYDFIKQPENLKYELRPYQVVGLNWLYLLFQQKINGILADEMGLGKTIETISLFSLLKQRGEAKKPHLIIVPATALENWVREFNMWCPSLVVAMYHGSAKERELLRKQLLPKEDGSCSSDVIITTYNLSINKADRVKFFKKFEFAYIVLDEAHNIKNVSSVRYQNLLKLAFRADYRLMLTGTPLQNNINELWALLNFLMPTIFGCTKDFKNLIWPEEDEKKDHSEEVERIKKIISPFLLRRLKSEVLCKLPPKQEEIVWCEPTPFQRELYMKTCQSSRTSYHEIKNEEAKQTAELTETEKEKEKEKEKEAEKVKEAEKEKEKEKEAEKAKEAEKEKPTAEKTIKKKIADTEEEKDDNEKSLHHILMQLRKAANNPLLFRHHYSDEKLKEIEEAFKLYEEESKRKLLEEQKQAEEALKAQQEKHQQEDKQALNEGYSMDSIETKEKSEEEDRSPEEISEMEVDTNNLKKEESSLEESGNRPTQEVNDEEMPDLKSELKIEKDHVMESVKSENQKAKSEATQEETSPECSMCPDQTGKLIQCSGSCLRYFHTHCAGVDDSEDKWACEDCEILNNFEQENENKKSEHRAKFDAIIAAVESMADKSGRYRSDLFVFLPSRAEYPEYYEMIKHPVSISQIKKKLYNTPEDFLNDCMTICTNAKTFNTPKSDVYKDALALEGTFKREFNRHFSGVTFDESNEEEEFESPKKKRAKPKTPKSTPKASTPRRKASQSSFASFPDSVRRSARDRKKRMSDDDLWENDEDFFAPSKKKQKTQQTPTPTTRKKKLKEPFLSCQGILEDLMDQEDATPFNAPVDPIALGIPDYHDVVKNPMDLGTIWQKLNNSNYKSTDEFVDDVRLVFDNCLLYNEPSSEIGISASMLWTYFKRQCRKNAIKLPEAKTQLANKNLTTSNAANLAEELKLKSDSEINAFCRNYEPLHKFCLTDDQIFNSSGKLIELRKKLEHFFQNKSRLLIFSQFTQVLNILEEFLSRLGYKFVRLDGSTPVLDRQMLIDEYNTNMDIFVFLLSTRAGGMGINLTSADVCIFHDIDWNPEMDRQAEARIHRIGQMKQVKIVKLLTRESVDEYILKLAESKRQRNDEVMGEEDTSKKAISLNSLQELDKLSIGKVLAAIFEHADSLKV